MIRNSADRAQVALAASGPFVLVFPFFITANIIVEAAVWLGVWLFICRHNYILHNHVHCPFTTDTRVNRVIGVLLGFCTGMTVGNWKITHVHGHHVEHKAHSAAARRCIHYLRVGDNHSHSVRAGILHAVRTAPLQWLLPVCEMVRGSFGASRTRRKFFRFYLAEFLVVYGVVAIMVWSSPLKGFVYFGLMYSLVYLFSRYIDYITHVASHGSSAYSFANVCLDPAYNRTFWNFGFHVAHHVRPSAHWTLLPALHDTLRLDQVSEPVVVHTNLLGLLTPPVFRWHRVRDAAGHPRASRPLQG